MPAIELPSLADHLVSLPPEGPGRNRELQRLVDTHASAAAATALHTVAARTRGGSGVLGVVLGAADVILSGAPEGSRLPAADSAARDRLRDAVTSPSFLGVLPDLIHELREIASTRPDTGACTLATAFELWSCAFNHFQASNAASALQVIDELAEAICPLVAARCLLLEITSAAIPGDAELRSDLCHVYSARAAASSAAVCAELVFGYRRHLTWDSEGCAGCYAGEDIDDLEALMPGIASGARMSSDVIEADGTHAAKAGPCARFTGVEPFVRLRAKLDGCLTGARIAKDRAAAAIARPISADREGKS